MKKQSKKKVKDLLTKYSTNICRKEEFEELFSIINNSERRKDLNQLLNDKWNQTRRIDFIGTIFYKYASIAVAIVILFTTAFFIREFTKSPPTALAAQQEPQQEQIIHSTKQITLSDGSIITLRDNSKLSYPEHFNGIAREVCLEGEAYFDIARNLKQPFIIHTGTVKTTVLGTAFSIKALPGDQLITVTVTHGKVKVENEKALLAVLEADKQFVYNKNTFYAEEKIVNAEKENAWKAQDLQFKNASFKTITQELCNIYHVRIEFDSELLKNKLITASIDNNESLDRILELLCTAQHAYFVVNDNIYVIKENII